MDVMAKSIEWLKRLATIDLVIMLKSMSQHLPVNTAQCYYNIATFKLGQ